MSNSNQLSQQRLGTIINRSSKDQEKIANKAHNIALHHFNKDVINYNSKLFITHEEKITNEFAYNNIHSKKSGDPKMSETYSKPDGGITFLNIKINEEEKEQVPLLVYECKKQGTNKERQNKGLPKQSKGNAIERAFKNITFCKKAFPNVANNYFVVFGYGDDFHKGSSIIYRMMSLHNFDLPFSNKFNLSSNLYNKNTNIANYNCDASVYLKEEEWKGNEMAETMYFTMFSMYISYCVKYNLVPSYNKGAFWNL